MGEVTGGRTRDKSHQVRGRKTKESSSNKQLMSGTVPKLSSVSVTVPAAVLHAVFIPLEDPWRQQMKWGCVLCIAEWHCPPSCQAAWTQSLW